MSNYIQYCICHRFRDVYRRYPRTENGALKQRTSQPTKESRLLRAVTANSWQLALHCHLMPHVPPVVLRFICEAHIHHDSKFQQNRTIRGCVIQAISTYNVQHLHCQCIWLLLATPATALSALTGHRISGHTCSRFRVVTR